MQAIWARARAAFLKYAASRASEVEDLFKKQQAQVEAAVKAGLVIVEDDGTTVPITRQGDLAHYTIVSVCECLRKGCRNYLF